MTMRWHQALTSLMEEGTAHCLVTVLQVQGSAPRAVGAKMVVTLKSTFDTVGGGNLEYEAINQARQSLADKLRQTYQREFILGDQN